MRDVNNNVAGGSVVGVSLNGKNFSFMAFDKITLGHRDIQGVFLNWCPPKNSLYHRNWLDADETG